MQQVLFCGGLRVDLSVPAVMGILNITPDSFYDGGRYPDVTDILKLAEKMLSEGAGILDVGAVSTRPKAGDVTEEEELRRLLPVLKALSGEFSSTVISVDTYRAAVAREAVNAGATMINDIYGGRFDAGMMETVSSLGVPYILMHMKGTPRTMQDDPAYSDVMAEVAYFLSQQLERCREAGIRQVIIDPGFGFGKTTEHNFTLLARLEEFRTLEVPILAGLSRKSMINRVLGTTPADALNGTTVLNTIALLKGADILRVHDVKEAVETVKLIRQLNDASESNS